MVTPSAVVTIGRRFIGPPSSGNGGYTAGLVAEHVALAPDQPVTVTLRRPPPLDTPLRVVPSSESDAQEVTAFLLLDGDAVVAEAGPGEFTADAVESVTPAQADAAQASYQGLDRHPFPTCFVCGTGRHEGDGLRLRPGPVSPGRTACVWTPDASLADDAGRVPDHFVWAALDCPSAWTSDLDARPLVLGRLTAACYSQVKVGAPYVVVAQLLSEQGRKSITASALYDAEGIQVARGEEVWIAVDPATFA